MNMTSTAADGNRGQTAPRAGYTLFVLASIWCLNFVDRNILGVLLEPIKKEFGISDTMLGFMTGFGFVLFYSLASIPLARLADRTNRVAVITIGLIVWSATTMLSAFAASALMLLLFRALVGIGEASSAGPSQAILSDYYPPAKRGRVLSVLSIATFLGVMLAFAVGGTISAKYGWRSAFLVAGAPGFVLALLLWFTVSDIPPGQINRRQADASAPFRDTLRFLLSQKSIVFTTAGFCFTAFVNVSILTWVAPMMLRVHHMDPATVGMTVGPIAGLAGIVGAMISVAVMNKLSARDMAWLAKAPAMAQLACIPFMLLFALAPDAKWALIGLTLTTILSGFQVGPLMAVVQSASKASMRSQAGALTLMVFNLVGWALGPLVIGAISDALQPSMGDQSLRYAFLADLVALLLSAFFLSLACRHVKPDIARINE